MRHDTAKPDAARRYVHDANTNKNTEPSCDERREVI